MSLNDNTFNQGVTILTAPICQAVKAWRFARKTPTEGSLLKVYGADGLAPHEVANIVP